MDIINPRRAMFVSKKLVADFGDPRVIVLLDYYVWDLTK